MATRQQFLKRCQELKVEVEEPEGTIHISTKRGELFASYNVHMLSIDWDHPPGRCKKTEAYDILLAEMSLGVMPCTTTDCDYCCGY